MSATTYIPITPTEEIYLRHRFRRLRELLGPGRTIRTKNAYRLEHDLSTQDAVDAATELNLEHRIVSYDLRANSLVMDFARSDVDLSLALANISLKPYEEIQ